MLDILACFAFSMQNGTFQQYFWSAFQSCRCIIKEFRSLNLKSYCHTHRKVSCAKIWKVQIRTLGRDPQAICFIHFIRGSANEHNRHQNISWIYKKQIYDLWYSFCIIIRLFLHIISILLLLLRVFFPKSFGQRIAFRQGCLSSDSRSTSAG